MRYFSKKLVLPILITGIVIACTSIKSMRDNQRKTGHYKLYTYPSKTQLPQSDERYKVVNLFSVNDFNQQIAPQIFSIPNRFGENRNLEYGGFGNLLLYTKKIKEIFPESLLINAGNYFSDENLKQQIFKANLVNFDISILGKNEWSFLTKNNTPKSLDREFSKLNHPILVSNFFDLKNVSNFKWRNFQNYQIKKVGDLRIGFINIVPQGFAEIIDKNFLSGIFIQKTILRVIELSHILRRKNVDIIALVIPESTDCSKAQAENLGLPIEKVNFIPFKYYYCENQNHEVLAALEKMPHDTVDIIFSSGSANLKTANFIHNTPVLQNFGNGQFLSWATLVFDTKFHKIDKQKTIIHQPIQLCKNFLKKHLDCYAAEKLDNQELIPAIFQGEKLSTN